jgi:prevent-host-death family protein
MASVGVKQLKNHLSDYLSRVRNGERILITDRGRPIASLAAVAQAGVAERAWALVRSGRASWEGGKPRGSDRPARLAGRRSVSDMVIEDRR